MVLRENSNMPEQDTRALMLMQAAIRSIKAAQQLFPLDNRLDKAEKLIADSYAELQDHVKNHHSVCSAAEEGGMPL